MVSTKTEQVWSYDNCFLQCFCMQNMKLEYVQLLLDIYTDDSCGGCSLLSWYKRVKAMWPIKSLIELFDHS